VKAPADKHALARACAEVMWADDRASQAMGMAIEAIAPGHALLAMTVTAQMVNGLGLCHGGYIFSLADSAMAFACNSHNERAVAQHCSISYLRPAKLGMRLVAAARELSRAGRTGVIDVSVTGDGAVIAEFRGSSRDLGQRFFED